ncbi:SCO family protein [Acidipila sp. 4G-K13]|uniref:Redoxin n=2 Tax=Paracidobacterium acidisoli TaxID=2303751 RepID=A0A372IU77_9BACT|nr:SCO family protein [Paracidobacterium acidisoli]MBT9329927.1 SCO family protein [Paracidobacterium acidisoli]
MKQYHVRGIVVSTDPSTGEVMLDTDAIPGFMEAMTMPYKLRQPDVLSELHPGDTLTATLLVPSDPASNQEALLDEIDVIAQRQPDYKPAAQFHPLNAGDAVPDFKLLNQNGRTIHLGEFHGKVLLVTFIYTRCPLPAYCIRMSRNFAQIDKALAADPKLYAGTHLLSVSFDPENDTPKVLRSYGSGYIGSDAEKAFRHWDFAAPPQPELAKVLQFFDVGVTPEKDHTITHSLSTVVIAPDGKVYKWYPTNDWTPDQVLGDVRQLISGQAHG